MKKAGFDVVMVSADGRERNDVMQFEECPHHIVPMTRKITPFADAVSFWRLYRLLKKEKPDIVHSHTPKAGLLAMVAAKYAGVKIRIHTIAGLRFMTSSGITRTVLTKMEKITAHAATHVWPNSLSLLNYIKQHKLVNAEKLEIIGKGSSNGVDLSRFSVSVLDEQEIRKAREVISYDPSLFYILSVGRIVKDKGIRELAKAFVDLYKENDRLRLVLVGTFEEKLDPLDEEIMQLIKNHPGIILAGWHDDVEYYMRISGLLVHASYREGFPNVVLQAGAMECPVVCSRIEGNIDIVDEDVNGLVFTAGDEKDLYTKLKVALADPAGSKKRAVLLRKKVEENFDRCFVQEKLRQRYESLLSASNNT
jgi:glycosyltransferase involved in cell wall biosynthesis